MHDLASGPQTLAACPSERLADKVRIAASSFIVPFEMLGVFGDAWLLEMLYTSRAQAEALLLVLLLTRLLASHWRIDFVPNPSCSGLRDGVQLQLASHQARIYLLQSRKVSRSLAVSSNLAHKSLAQSGWKSIGGSE
jgi:hypothetical protein